LPNVEDGAILPARRPRVRAEGPFRRRSVETLKRAGARADAPVMWRRRRAREQEAWVSTAPAPKAEQPAEVRSHVERATYEDSWYEVLRRSPAEEATAESSADPE
ncbi:MAG: hypothetical protein ACM3OO_13355, partial [Planctomycetaceae bacterium]